MVTVSQLFLSRLYIDSYKNTGYRIIVMDIQIPVMDGYEAAVCIRRIESYQEIPIAAMTVNAMKEDKEKCLAAGMNGHISKPLDIDKVITELENYF